MRRALLGCGHWAVGLVIGLWAAVAFGNAARATFVLPSEGHAQYTVQKGGVPLGVARLEWQVAPDGRYRIVLASQTTGLAGLLSHYAETRISEGRVVSGWWVPERSVRQRPGKDDEVIARAEETVVVTRKGQTLRYPAPPTAQDFLSLLFSMPSRAAAGKGDGETVLLGAKRGKAITFLRAATEAVTLPDGQTVLGLVFHAETQKKDWQVTAEWQVAPIVRLVRLEVNGEEGDFVYELAR
ncbi:DUF3108 domain-containing protein [Hydrogenophilus thiooxidans]|uniref:DUF3108 domain-containing protein n=1 Tax=Hydrogenophilus thiooxidans TaxID=2820326 RepID=UPI001C22F1BC|nr:DUF3108 domain-containing protein [Hydrogenophilus thiooxidans]